MAYEPALTSFILVGVVGGVALVMNLSADWEVTHELSRATDAWTRARSYDNKPSAQRRASQEAAILLAHGYEKVPLRGEVTPFEAGISPGAGVRTAATTTESHAKIVITYRLA